VKVNFRKIKGFLYKYRYSLAIVFVALVAAVGIAWYLLGQNIVFKAPAFNLIKPKDDRVVAPLTGELVDPSVITKRPIAVIIENYTDARPQSGYNDADIVYETLAEGGITRTLAIFQSKASTEIGPVRSARPYFIDWLTEYSALFAHVGGSYAGLNLIQQIKVPDLNQFYNATAYWRSSDREAPHNVYTTTDKLYAAAKANGLEITATVPAFNFKKDADIKQRSASEKVDIDFSYSDYHVTYNYDSVSNTYLRSIAGVIAKDKNTGVQIAPKNVIVELTPISSYTDPTGEPAENITTIGTGKGILFQDGKATQITWSKSSREARTKYLDINGRDCQLNPGQTWIEVVPTGNNVTY